jgi:hypothetical protein
MERNWWWRLFDAGQDPSSSTSGGHALLVQLVPATSHSEENFRVDSTSFGGAFDGQTCAFQHFAALFFAL